jgi:hypothetical protein
MARPALTIRLIGDKDRAGRDQGDSYPIGNGRAPPEDEHCEIGGQVNAELIKRPDLRSVASVRAIIFPSR